MAILCEHQRYQESGENRFRMRSQKHVGDVITRKRL